jgi:hypothetical protein
MQCLSSANFPLDGNNDVLVTTGGDGTDPLQSAGAAGFDATMMLLVTH